MPSALPLAPSHWRCSASKARRRLLTAATFFIAIEIVPVAARAAEPRSPGAEHLFSDGLKLAQAGDCVRARDKFTESYAVEPAPGTLINWALCEEKLGRPATALQLLQVADQTLPANHPKRAAMVKHMEVLVKRAPLLRLRVTSPLPAGTTVTMDGAVLDASVFARGALGDPGRRIIEVRAPGREDSRYEATLAEGTTLEITVGPGGPARGGQPVQSGAVASEAAPPGALTAPTDTAPPSAPSATLGWALAGGGAAAIGVGAVTGLLAKNKWNDVQSDCNVDTKQCVTDDGVQASTAGRTLATVSTTAFIVGGVSLAVGGYLLLTRKDAPATARVAATAGPGGVGLRLAGEF